MLFIVFGCILLFRTALSAEGRLDEPQRQKLLQEAGYKDLVVQPWFGLLAPAKVPPAILEKLNAAFNEAMRDPTVLKRFSEIDLQPVGGSGADFQKLIRAEAQKWGKLVREKNITAE